MLATAQAQELQLLQKRLRYIEGITDPEAQIEIEALRKIEPDVSDLHALIYTLERLQPDSDCESVSALLREREILKMRVARLAKVKTMPKTLYEFYEPEFETLAATVRTLKFIRSPPRHRSCV